MNKTLTAALLAIAAATAAHATTVALPTNGNWAQFDVDNSVPFGFGTPSWVDLLDGSLLSFQVVVPTGYTGVLTVVDTGASGDRFQVFANGTSLGITSAAVNSYPTTIGQADFEIALANSNYSRGVFSLNAGSYSITGALSQSALDTLGGTIDATSGGLKVAIVPVPEPSTLLTMLAGVGVLAAALRRRKA